MEIQINEDSQQAQKLEQAPDSQHSQDIEQAPDSQHAQETSPEGLELYFKDVTIVCSDKNILKNVYGAVSTGQLMAVMGPSGSGKTTLLNTLAGRMPLQSGEITLDGLSLSKQMKRKICYVLQQDCFFPNVTLLDTLMFTAMLRLPDEMPMKRKVEKMFDLIDELDLRDCIGTHMGGMWMPGLSGGEMKHASIACELITDPAIILLDEPTSGLDYRTALNLIQTLKRYTEVHKKTVVMSIHQPSSQIFYQFDTLLLMCDGHIFYISMHWGFTPLFDAVTSFPMEKGVIYKERAAGWYRLSAYYLAKSTSELPIIFIQPVLFLGIVYWVVGLNGVASFFAMIGTIFVHSIAGQSIGLCVGIYAMDMRRGISLGTVIIMFFMLLGGFYTRHLPSWLNWVKYLAFLHYTYMYHCLLYLEFTELRTQDELDQSVSEGLQKLRIPPSVNRAIYFLATVTLT